MRIRTRIGHKFGFAVSNDRAKTMRPNPMLGDSEDLGFGGR